MTLFFMNNDAVMTITVKPGSSMSRPSKISLNFGTMTIIKNPVIATTMTIKMPMIMTKPS